MNNFNIFISENAEKFLKQQVKENKAIQLRLKSSGCSGYAYVLNVIENTDNVLKIKGIPFDILDSDKEYLNDTLIDYKKDGLSSKIVFENPQAFNHCGCGESFSIRK